MTLDNNVCDSVKRKCLNDIDMNIADKANIVQIR